MRKKPIGFNFWGHSKTFKFQIFFSNKSNKVINVLSMLESVSYKYELGTMLVFFTWGGGWSIEEFFIWHTEEILTPSPSAIIWWDHFQSSFLNIFLRIFAHCVRKHVKIVAKWIKCDKYRFLRDSMIVDR